MHGLQHRLGQNTDGGVRGVFLADAAAVTDQHQDRYTRMNTDRCQSICRQQKTGVHHHHRRLFSAQISASADSDSLFLAGHGHVVNGRSSPSAMTKSWRFASVMVATKSM